MKTKDRLRAVFFFCDFYCDFYCDFFANFCKLLQIWHKTTYAHFWFYLHQKVPKIGR